MIAQFLKNGNTKFQRGWIFGKIGYNENEGVENKTSILKGLPNFLGGEFFKSEWSFAQVRLTDHRSICCFGAENNIIVVSTEGKYYKAEIDMEKGGDCKIIQEEQLL